VCGRLDYAESLNNGRGKVAVLDDAVRQADLLGDGPLQYDARMELISALYYIDGAEQTLTHFAWVLKHFDGHREDFDWFGTVSLMWKYKWVLNAAQKFPQVPLSRVRELHADFARRVREEGMGARTVPYFGMQLAEHLGDHEAARAQFSLWQYTGRDVLSDCEACEAHSLVEYHAFQGQEERAVRAAAPILAGRETCAHVPHITHAALLAPLMRLGRWAEAAEQHRLGAPLVKGDDSLISSQAEHLAYLGAARRFGEAASWYDLHARDALSTHDPDRQLEFHAGAAVYLHALARSKTATLPVKSPGPAHATAATLADWHEAGARALAARFDARNGTDWQTRRLESVLALADLTPV
jgi:hypothetical protein